jgi:hypothetical protein
MNPMLTSPDMILHYGVYVLLALLCIACIVRALLVPSDVYRQACCGACGHAVADVLQGRCPECGAMYAKAGISTPSMAVRMRGSLAMALLAWTTLIMMGGSYTHGWLQQRAWTMAAGMPASTKQQETLSCNFAPSVFGSGRSLSKEDRAAMEFRLNVSISAVTDGGVVESGVQKLGLRRNGTSDEFILEIKQPDGVYTLTGPQGELESGAASDLNNAFVSRWYKSAGIVTGREVIENAMTDTLKVVRYAVNDPTAVQHFASTYRGSEPGSLQSQGMSASSGGVGGGAMFAGPPTPATRDLGVAAAILGALYVVGCILLAWRHRRLVRGVATRETAAPHARG